MRLKLQILILTLFLSVALMAQDQYNISSDLRNLSFREFVPRAEKQFHVKFFYKDEWVQGLNTGDHKDCSTLKCILDNMFNGTSLFYIIEESGNIVITNRFAVKVTVTQAEKVNNYMPPSEYAGSVESRRSDGNLSIDIGNPAE